MRILCIHYILNYQREEKHRVFQSIPMDVKNSIVTTNTSESIVRMDSVINVINSLKPNET